MLPAYSMTEAPGIESRVGRSPFCSDEAGFSKVEKFEGAEKIYMVRWCICIYIYDIVHRIGFALNSLVAKDTPHPAPGPTWSHLVGFFLDMVFPSSVRSPTRRILCVPIQGQAVCKKMI